jgi:hypothetical protein
MVWRSLAILVKYGHVEMGVGIAVMFADLNNISFAPARMALCADSYHSCQPMYSSVVTFTYGRFLWPGKFILSICLLSRLNGRRTRVFRKDERP